MAEVPADRPGQFVMAHDARFVGWVGLSRRDPERPGRFAASGPSSGSAYGIRAERPQPGESMAPSTHISTIAQPPSSGTATQMRPSNLPSMLRHSSSRAA